MEKRQPVFDPGVFAARADGLIQRIVRACGPELNAVGLPKAGDRGAIKDDLGHRGQLNPLELFGRALALRVKAAQPVERVTKEVQPNWRGLTRGPNVDDAAPERVIARLHHG